MTRSTTGNPIRARRLVPLAVLVALAALLCDTAAAADAPRDKAAQSAQPVFYPPAPDPPRLQFLAKFSSAYDVASGKGGLRSLVFGGEELEEHLVQKPYGLAIFEGALYVVDTRGSGYAIFDLAAKRTRVVKGSGASAMPKPVNLTIDADGTRYLTDTQREVVLVFDRNDRFVRTLGDKGQFRPVDLAIVGDRLYVTDIEHMKVHVLDKRSGKTLAAFGEAGSKPGQLFHPTNIAVGPDRTLYITDTTNFRIQQFTLDGEFIREIGQIGVSPGQFARPKGVALDREGRIYAVDAAFENVQVLDTDGAPLTFFGGPGDGPGNINLPTVVKVDYDNVKYFRQYAAPGFEIEYLVLVASQFGANKVAVYGFGAMKGNGGGARAQPAEKSGGR